MGLNWVVLRAPGGPWCAPDLKQLITELETWRPLTKCSGTEVGTSREEAGLGGEGAQTGQQQQAQGRVVGPFSAAYSTGLQPLPCDKDARSEHAPSSVLWPGVEWTQRQHQGSNLRFLDAWQEKVGEAIRRRTVG